MDDITYDRYLKANKMLKISYFTNSLGSTLITSIFVVFLSMNKGFGSERAGLIIGLTPLLVVPFILFWGSLVDDSKKIVKFLVFIHIMNGLLMLSLVFIDNFYIFFLVNLIKTIITLPAGSLTDEYLLFLVTKANFAFGRTRIFGTLGYAAAGILGPIVTYFFGISGSILLGGVLIVFSVFFYVQMPELVFEEKLKSAIPIEKTKLSSMLKLFKNKYFVLVLFSTICIMGTVSAFSSYGLQTTLIQLKTPDTLIATLPLTMVVLEVVFLRVMDRFDTTGKEFRIYLIAALICFIRWGIYLFAKNYSIIIALAPLHGLVSGVVLPVQSRLVGNSVDHSQRSSAFLLMAVIAYTIAPSAINLFTSTLSLSIGTIAFTSVYLVITTIGIILILRKIRADKNAYRNNLVKASNS